MIIEPPKTLKEFQEIMETILGLMANPYCDEGMKERLCIKLIKIEHKINNLTQQ